MNGASSSTNPEAPSPLPFKEASLLKEILRSARENDRQMRQYQVRRWEMAEHYWGGSQDLYYDDRDNLWREIGDRFLLDHDSRNRTYNIYKPRGESIIANIANGISRVKFYPKSTKDPKDVHSARAFSKLAEIIQRESRMDLENEKVGYNAWNFGPTYAYSQVVMSRRETYERPRFQPMVRIEKSCTVCGDTLPVETNEAEKGEPIGSVREDMSLEHCDTCGGEVSAKRTRTVDFQQVGSDAVPVPKVRVRVFGPLDVEVPSWTRRMEEAPYLVWTERVHVSQARSRYKSYARFITADDEDEDEYDGEETAGSSSLFLGDESGVVKIRHAWIAPFLLRYGDPYDEDDEETRMGLVERFPEGVKATFVSGTLVKVRPETLVQRWTAREESWTPIPINPPAMGAGLIDLQDITNENVNLVQDSIQYSIPETFVDEQAINIDAYNQSPARAGNITGVKSAMNRSISDNFWAKPLARLPNTSQFFMQFIDSAAKEVSGDHDSVHGGAGEGSASKTLGEWEGRQAGAMTRLGPQFRSINRFISRTMENAVRLQVRLMKEGGFELSNVEAHGKSFEATYVKLAELAGEVGEVLPENADRVPVTWKQKRAALFDMLQMPVPAFQEAVSHPENATFLTEVVGLTEDLFLPAQQSREKQLLEIEELLESGPPPPPNPLEPNMPAYDQNGMPSSTIQPMDTDDHQVEAMICLVWMRSDRGRVEKEENPQGFANVWSHYQQHVGFADRMAVQSARSEGGPQMQMQSQQAAANRLQQQERHEQNQVAAATAPGPQRSNNGNQRPRPGG